MSNPFKREATVALNDLSVFIGMPVHRDIPPKTTVCLVETVKHCARLSIPCVLGMVSAGNVVNGRDEVLSMFLKSDCNRLFWIDSDMTWTINQFVRLLALSKLTPVVGATYPAKIDPRPTFFVKFASSEKNELGLIEVEGLGLGFTIVRREVMEKLAEGKPQVMDEVSGSVVSSVFRWDVIDGKRRGEDMAFFSDLRELGYKVMLDPLTDLGHIGNKEYTGTIRDALA